MDRKLILAAAALAAALGATAPAFAADGDGLQSFTYDTRAFPQASTTAASTRALPMTLADANAAFGRIATP